MLVAVLSLLLWGCRPDEICRQDLSVAAGVTLRGISVDTSGIGTEFTQWDSITVQGIGSDSVLYDNSKSVTTLHLPLRADSNVTAYRVTWRGMDDVLYFRHDNTRRYISMACGCIIYHVIDTVWCAGVWMDSVRLLNSTVESASQDNVKIFTTVPE